MEVIKINAFSRIQVSRSILPGKRVHGDHFTLAIILIQIPIIFFGCPTKELATESKVSFVRATGEPRPPIYCVNVIQIHQISFLFKGTIFLSLLGAAELMGFSNG